MVDYILWNTVLEFMVKHPPYVTNTMVRVLYTECLNEYKRLRRLCIDVCASCPDLRAVSLAIRGVSQFWEICRVHARSIYGNRLQSVRWKSRCQRWKTTRSDKVKF